jgi:hypothetical protein
VLSLKISARRLASALAAAAALALPAAAHAQDCVRSELDTKSADYAVAATMAGRYMRLASAANYADRSLLKQLENNKADYDGGKGAFGLRWDWFFGATSAPVQITGQGCPGLSKVPFDMYSANLGMAFQYKYFYAYYASSVGAAAAQDSFGRAVGATFTPITGNIYSVVAPFVGASSGSYKGIIYSFDYIAGAGFASPWLSAAVGYVGSQGAFARISQVDTKLVGAAALRTLTKELAYVRAGLDFLRVVKSAKDDVLSIAPYFRQITQAPPERLIDRAEGTFEEAKDLKGFAFRTLHAEAANLIKYVDAQAAYGLPPFNNLHQLALRAHTTGSSLAGQTREQIESKRYTYGGALSIGVVRVPEQRLLNQAGKPLLSVSAEALFLNGHGRLAFNLNNPEILSQYPTASNAVNLTFEFLMDPGAR